MEREEIVTVLQDIMKDVFETDNVSLTNETTAADIEEWDSLNHIQLVVAVEKHFNFRFTSKEIQSWNNVGEMVDCIQQKL